MLRITVVENALEDQWTLQGTLTKGSVRRVALQLESIQPVPQAGAAS